MLPGEMDGQRVLRALRRLGWEVASVHGSHHKLVGPGGMRLIVAFHGTMGRPAVLRCLKQAGIRPETFERVF